MRALVTGVAGFIGSTIAARLAVEGWDVLGVDALTDYYDVRLKRENLERLPDSVQVEVARLKDLDLPAVLSGVDVVLHQAGQPGVRTSWGRDFAVYVEQNIEATQLLLEAARRAPNLDRFVYASSSSVYGDAPRFPTTEDDCPRPVSPYGVTKLAAEHLCSLYAANFGVPTVSLRYFTVYGPRQRPDMAFTSLLTAAAADTPITLFGDGEQVRDFTFVDDVVDANVRAATAPDVPVGTVLNISGGTNVSINEVLDIMGRTVGHRLEIDRHPRSDGDVLRTGGDSSRAATLLGWHPQVGVEEGIARQWEWVRGRRA